MLPVLLCVLKWAGILLLVLLALVFAAALLVLLVPIRYRLSGSWHGALRAGADISWLFHLLSLQITYEDGPTYSLRLFGFPLFSSKYDEQEEESGAQEETWEPRQSPAAEPSRPEPAQPLPEREDPLRKEPPRPLGGRRRRHWSLGRFSRKLKKAVLDFFRRLFAGRQQLGARIRRVQKILQDPSHQAAFAFLTREVKKILAHIRPRKAAGEVVFGFDDPAVTGQVLTFCAVPAVWYGGQIRFTPVFEEEILDADVSLSGRIRTAVLLILGLQVILNKDVKRLRRHWRTNGGI